MTQLSLYKVNIIFKQLYSFNANVLNILRQKINSNHPQCITEEIRTTSTEKGKNKTWDSLELANSNIQALNKRCTVTKYDKSGIGLRYAW